MPPSAEKYEPLLNEGSDHQPDDGRHSAEYGLRLPLSSRRRERTVKLLVALDAVLAALLLVLVVVLWREKAMVPAPPYSPAWEAVRYVNKRFEKDDRFYADNETDAAVDEIWLNLTGPSNGHIKFDTAEARKNVPSLELYYDGGHYIYGLNMFHQIHCLDVIRKSFFPEHYFPGKKAAAIRDHKQHCFDFLRQAIMCSGDVTIDHWFNYDWTTPSFAADGEGKDGEDWMSMYNDKYRRLTPKERNDQAPLLWDTTHQCRDYDTLWRWVEGRQLVDNAYEKEFGTDVDTF